MSELSEKEMGGYQDGWLACEKQNKEFLETARKELEKLAVERRQVGTRQCSG